MDMAVKLAEKGKGTVSPNPLVGCIIVKRGKIVGKGFHKECGNDHAEIMAIKSAGKKVANATMYVTLEPCSHWGKTPPCTEKIVQSGIREVIIGAEDPNPVVDGFKELKFRGLKVKIGILKEDAEKLNEYYNKYMKTKTPFAMLKVAMTMDGKVATNTGDSKYITGSEARKFVHELRSEVDAVMVGVNTILKDDPKLTPRLVSGPVKDPFKIVVDSNLRLPVKCNVMKNPSKLIIATTSKASKERINKFYQMGVNVVVCKTKLGKVDLKDLMAELGKKEITSVMIEGGPMLNSSVIRDKIADKLLIFTAPKIMGDGLGAIGDLGIKRINNAVRLKSIKAKKVGKDILIEAYM